MNVTKGAVVAVPAVMLVMMSTVQGVAQAADAMQREPSDAGQRIRKAEWVIGGALVVAAFLSGDTTAVVATAATVGIAYYLVDMLVVKG